jgi:cysteine desulfuration protein SufE
MDRLDNIIDTFQSVEPETRLELLLDYSQRLPPLPDRLKAQRDAGLHRVPECMTPVFLWVERDNGHVRLYVDVAEEAPTVKGIVSILVDAFDGRPTEAFNDLPLDLVHRLGLQGHIRMQREVGLSAISGRIKREALAAKAS